MRTCDLSMCVQQQTTLVVLPCIASYFFNLLILVCEYAQQPSHRLLLRALFNFQSPPFPVIRFLSSFVGTNEHHCEKFFLTCEWLHKHEYALFIIIIGTTFPVSKILLKKRLKSEVASFLEIENKYITGVFRD